MSPSILEALVPRDEGRPTYASLVVDELIELKRDSWEWERAWSIATAKHPPPLTWQRSGAGVESPFHFLRRHCEAAYHDRHVPTICDDCGCSPCTCVLVDLGAVV